jgi:hypothetical protein
MVLENWTCRTDRLWAGSRRSLGVFIPLYRFCVVKNGQIDSTSHSGSTTLPKPFGFRRQELLGDLVESADYKKRTAVAKTTIIRNLEQMKAMTAEMDVTGSVLSKLVHHKGQDNLSQKSVRISA